MQDYRNFWDQLSTLTRNDVVKMAHDELLDVKGLSMVKQILYKYNLSHVTIDHRLNFVFKKSPDYCPRKDLEDK